VLIGCGAESVAANGQEIEEAPAVTLWAGVFGPVAPVRLWGERTEDEPGGQPIEGWPPSTPFPAQALVLLADPYTFAIDAFLRERGEHQPDLPILGGMASAGHGPGGNRLALNDRVFAGGAVGAFVGPGVQLETVVSQGCRPIGRPLVVTRAERNVIYELAGQPALERLLEMARDGMPERDIQLINQGLHVGLVLDEHKVDFGRGDFLIRNVLGADRTNGAMAVGELVDVGATVQFHVRDAASADEDLRELLAFRHADGALLFTCNGRGTRLFDQPDHDAGVVSDLLGGPPLAGFFAAGELGPVGTRNFLHGFTASVVLFTERDRS
jgi:small ligand-binding sensory domain FIST